MPINELDRRDDPTFDERLSGCHLVSSCSNIYDKKQFGQMLRHNFGRHYSTNRQATVSHPTCMVLCNNSTLLVQPSACLAE
jgi:hypothetical protein